MTLAYQPSLLDLSGDTEVHAISEGIDHVDLGRGAWVEVRLGFLTSTWPLFERLVEETAWKSERRVMYDRVVDVPRLACHLGAGVPLAEPALERARDELDGRYRPLLGESLATTGLCLYRDGRDSVAWHGDRRGRGATEDTVVAILSLGATRSLLLRPRGGGRSRHFALACGDLLVMGGSCQRTFEHSLPKTGRSVGARISVQYRPRGVS